MIGESLWRYRGLVGTLTERELKLRYKRSVLGWLWSLINPAALLVIYMLVFGIVLRVVPPVAGNGELQSFALYLFIGLVIWNFFNATVTGSMHWLMQSGPLLQKVYFPPEAPVVAGALSVMVQALTETVILLAILAVVGNISYTAIFFPLVLAFLFLFALGLGLVAALLNVYFRDVAQIVPIGLTLLFYATPIVYTLDLVPEEIWGGVPAQDLFVLNPLTQFVTVSRDLLYDLRIPSLGRILAIVLMSLSTLAFGWWIFQRRAHLLSEEL